MILRYNTFTRNMETLKINVVEICGWGCLVTLHGHIQLDLCLITLKFTGPLYVVLHINSSNVLTIRKNENMSTCNTILRLFVFIATQPERSGSCYDKKHYGRNEKLVAFFDFSFGNLKCKRINDYYLILIWFLITDRTASFLVEYT